MNDEASAAYHACHTTQEEAHVGRMDDEQRIVFQQSNAQNQQNHRHNQGVTINGEEYAEYILSFDISCL